MINNNSSSNSDDGSDDGDDEAVAAVPWTRPLLPYRCQAASTLIDLYQYIGEDDDM